MVVTCSYAVRLDAMHSHAVEEKLTLQDVHGQFYDLLRIFELNGLPSEENPYLFNGMRMKAPTPRGFCPRAKVAVATKPVEMA